METKAYTDQITKWYVTKIFPAAILPTEAPKVWVITSQRYASVPFLDTTWNLVQTKAYIALITKWYVTKIFSVSLPRQKPPKFELWRRMIAKNFWLRIAWNLVQTKAYIALVRKWYCMWQKSLRMLHLRQKPPKFELWRHMSHFRCNVITRCDVKTRTLGTSAGGKAAENFSVTYHFVISAM